MANTTTDVISLVEANDKTIKFNFEHLFDLDANDLDVLYAPLTKKRVFQSIIPDIVETIQYFTDLDESLPERYVNIMYTIIQRKGDLTENELADLIFDEFINNSELIAAIIDKVENEYKISIEIEDSSANELQFNNGIAKLVINVAVMSRLIIPFIGKYMEINDIKKDVTITLNVFDKIFDVFTHNNETGEEVDLRTKLNKFVSTLVNNTLYSDKIIWEYLRNMSIDELTVSNDFYKKLIKDTLPKLQFNKSIVSFIYVVIKQQIQFQFTQNFKFSYKPLSVVKSSTGDLNGNSDINPFVKLESQLVTLNEYDYTLERASLTEFIKSIRSGIDLKVVKILEDNLEINSYHIKVINYILNSIDNINIYAATKTEFFMILYHVYSLLKLYKFNMMADLLLHNVDFSEDNNLKRINTGKSRILIEVINSNIYKKILSRYSIMSSKFEDNKVVVNFISSIICSQYKEIPNLNTSILRQEDLLNKSFMSEILTFLQRF